jgi:hypothetical protein
MIPGISVQIRTDEVMPGYHGMVYLLVYDEFLRDVPFGMVSAWCMFHKGQYSD